MDRSDNSVKSNPLFLESRLFGFSYKTELGYRCGVIMTFYTELSRIREVIKQVSPSEIKTKEFRYIIKTLLSKDFVNHDCPDGYSIDKAGECIIFEHFEIDAAKKSKKGSAFKGKQAEAIRAFAKEIQKPGDVCQFKATTKDGENIDFLVKCFQENYLKHYKNIELYKKNVLKNNPDIKNFKVCFVIEQLFSFGLVGYRDEEPGKFSYVQFPLITEVNDILKKYPIDFMLNIVHMPLTGGKIGLREIQLDDGRQAFSIEDPSIFHPDISFQTWQNVIDYKHSKSIFEFKADRNFMPGNIYYFIEAIENLKTDE